MPTPHARPAVRKVHPQILTFAPAFAGACFPTVPAPLTLAVQLSPQIYPLGQHPPPWPAAQLYHPVAQLPPCCAALVAVVVRAVTVAAAPTLLLESAFATEAPAGAAIVTPLLTTTVRDTGGHDVVSQFLPTLQHPPK